MASTANRKNVVRAQAGNHSLYELMGYGFPPAREVMLRNAQYDGLGANGDFRTVPLALQIPR